MCGRYTLAPPDPAHVRARFPVGDAVEIRRRYNVAPGDDVLAVTTDRAGRARGELLRWGLLPVWAEAADPKLKMINARVETVTERPAFRTAFARFRCLILADGFYEWAAVTPGAPKQAYHIAAASGEMFAFAGLWSSWTASNGNSVRSCAILTTQANAAVAPLHDRMPVILARGQEASWLDSATPQSELRDLLVGLSSRATTIRPVGPAVNDARYDGPRCLAGPEPLRAPASLF